MATTKPTTGSSPASSFGVPGYGFLWFTGWLWHIARWMAVFTTTFRVNELTGDPLLVQLVGACFMAPMFLGGVLAGALTDRLNGHRVVLVSLGVLIPLSGLMGLAVANDQAPLSVSYLFVFCIGIGNVVDMTSRRSLAFGLVGAGLVTNAAAYESLALQAGNMVGSFSGGAIIEAFGAAFGYVGIGVIYLAAVVSFSAAGRLADARALTNQPETEEPREPSTIGDDLRAGIGLLNSHVVLRQFLMTTALMNFFYFAFMPLVPVFAEDLGVGALLTGLLAAAAGMGTIVGALIIARVQPKRRGLVHICGAMGAMVMLVIFANTSWYPGALAALFVAGLFGSGFGTTQSALVISLVDDAVRGRALGVLSMAIGALPFGMFSLGLLARRTNPQLALTISISVGFVLLISWQVKNPHLRQLL